MTTIPFIPSDTASPPFQVVITLDGSAYTLSATWNIAGQRWYVQITDLSGNLVLNTPLIGSPLNADINLVFGYFTQSTLVYQADSGNFMVNP